MHSDWQLFWLDLISGSWNTSEVVMKGLTMTKIGQGFAVVAVESLNKFMRPNLLRVEMAERRNLGDDGQCERRGSLKHPQPSQAT